MKTLPGTFRLLGLIILVAAMVIALRALAQNASPRKWPPNPGHCQEPTTVPTPVPGLKFKKITSRRVLKNDSDQGEADFAALLCNGNYSADNGNLIHFRHKNGQYGEHCLPRDCADVAGRDIKTDQVIASKTAKSVEAGELTAIGAHVTIQIVGQTQADVDAVLNQLQ